MGLTFQQIGREGWGYQKSQNGGGTIPQPSLVNVSYHRYGSRVPASDKEKSFYDGIDVSLAGIATLAKGDTTFLRQGLDQISKIVEDACSRYRLDDPANIAPALADGLKATRALAQQVQESNLAEPGRSDVEYELRVKEGQFEKALTLALGLSFDAVIAPEREATGPFGGGANTTFTIAIPGQSFSVQAHLLNEGREMVNIDGIELAPSDGKNWMIHTEAPPTAGAGAPARATPTPAAATAAPAPALPPTLAGGKDVRLRFGVKAPDDARLTRPYFSRPDLQQPYYNLTDERYRNLSLPPYPLAASARITYHGTELEIRKVVQSNQRLEGIGIEEEPMLMGPAISVAVSPAAGAVPLSAASFAFSCSLHSNVKGPAQGVLRLRLPEQWESTPREYPFSLARDGDTETLTFQIAPHSFKAQSYEIKAVAE